MARIRTVKPDFWTDEKLTECSVSARLFFIGTWNFADDNGNLQRSAKKLKMQIFPADTFDCEPFIQELIAHGILIEYSVNGENYLHIKTFKKHQVINRPSKSQIPEPQFTEDSRSTPTPVQEGSLREGKGRERKGNNISVADDVEITREDVIATAANPATASPKIPIAPDWQPSDETVNALSRLHAVPLDFIDQEAAEFRIYWRDRGLAADSWDSKFLKRCADRWKQHLANPPPSPDPYKSDQGFIDRVTNRDWAKDLDDDRFMSKHIDSKEREGLE